MQSLYLDVKTAFIYTSKIPGYFMRERDILVTVYNEEKIEHL